MFSDTVENNGHLRPPPPPQQTPQDDQTTPRVLTLLSNVLERLVNRNDQLVKNNNTGDQLNHHQPTMINNGLSCGGSATIGRSLMAFDGVRPPNISIINYLERMYKYTNCSPSCFVVGFVYIDRLLHKFPASLVGSLNVHRLLVTCVMVASKMMDDVHYNNAVYAKVGGVSNSELNRLELELLFMLDFKVVVTSQVFQSYCQHLEKQMLKNGETPAVRSDIANAIDHDAIIIQEQHTNHIKCNSSSHVEDDLMVIN